MAEIVQLEIRGVGGATAAEILGGPGTQTAGDRLAGFYSPDVAPAHGRTIEAYEWGRLTSGGWTSAIWWVLFPFTLINVAGWMFHPNDAERARVDEPVRSSLWFGRLFVIIAGLAMTGVYVVWLVTLGTELVVFGCSSVPGCATRWFMAPVAWFDYAPVWHVALGTGLAAVVILGLFAFILRTQDNLEGYETDLGRRRVGLADSRRTDTSRLRRNTALDDQGFWYKWEEHRLLFRWHLGLTMLLLGGGAGHALARVGWTAPPRNAWAGIGVVVATIAGLVWRLCGPERFREADSRTPGSADRTSKQLGWTLTHLAIAGVGLASGILVTDLLETSRLGRFAYLDMIRLLSLVLYVVAALMLFVLLRRRLRGDASPQGLLWLMPGMAAALAIIVAGAGFVAVANLVGRLLLGAQWVTDNGFDIVLIDILGVAVIVTGAFVVIRYVRTAKPIQAVAADYFPGRSVEELSDRETEWSNSVAGSRVTATMLGEADTTLAFLIATLLVLTLVQLWRGDFDVRAGAAGAFAAPLFKIEGLRFFHTVAATVVVLYLFPGVQLIRANARSRDKRRQLGKVWDVLSFWPRRFHPLSAPCYAERAVPEFRNRIRHHLEHGRKVIVAAHSQGTVIAFASLLQIGAESQPIEVEVDGVEYGSYRDMLQSSEPSPDMAQQSAPLDLLPLSRAALMTYGSPLSRLYGRFFPWHFGAAGRCQAIRDRLATLASGGKAWRNLWRPTDYIGQKVFIEPGGVLDPQDTDADIQVREAAQPLFPFDSHSNYERDPKLAETVTLFATEM